MLIKFNYTYGNWNYNYYNSNLERHRLDGPCYENNYGDKSWLKNGMNHREDGPVVEWYNGDKDYYLNNKEYLEKEYWGIIRFGGFV